MDRRIPVLNLKQMEYFIAIISEESISTAVKTLHISQSPLSTQMKLLEKELGLILFQRGSRSILLTDAGKVLYRRAQGILGMTGIMLEELEQIGQGLLGSLRLGMIFSVETEPIIGKIAAPRQEHPGVKFHIYEGNTYQLLDKLNTEIIEAAIVCSPLPGEPYDRFYLSGNIMIAVDKRCFFPRPEADTISLKRLCFCPLAVYRRWEGALNCLSAPGCPDYLCINDDARTSLTWAETGSGVAMVPTFVVRCVRSNILMKSLSTRDSTSQITLVCQKNGSLSAVMKEPLDYSIDQPPLS